MAVFGAGALFFVVPNGIPDRMVSGMSIAFFPKLLLTLIIILSVFLALKTLIQARSAPPAEGLQNLSLDIILLLSLPVSYLVVKYLGISIFALLITPPVMIVYGEKRWGLIAVTAFTLAICARLVVVELLERPPLGIW